MIVTRFCVFFVLYNFCHVSVVGYVVIVFEFVLAVPVVLWLQVLIGVALEFFFFCGCCQHCRCVVAFVVIIAVARLLS